MLLKLIRFNLEIKYNRSRVNLKKNEAFLKDLSLVRCILFSNDNEKISLYLYLAMKLPLKTPFIVTFI